MVRRVIDRALAAAGLGAAVLAVVAPPAGATWSLLAVDEETGRVGAAMASCVESGVLGDPDRVLVPIALAPGMGGAVAQGTIDPEAPARLRQALADGLDAQATVDRLVAGDDEVTVRQYAAVTVEGGARPATAGFTGRDAEPVALVATGDGVIGQGTLVAGAEVVADAVEAYAAARAEGRTMEEALVTGLEAGSVAGGDRRCGDQTALFAHLAVADVGDDPERPSVLLTVTVDENDGQNPVPLLVEALAAGDAGWVDAGSDGPTGVPRLAVGVLAVLLAAGAAVAFRRGLGSPRARRGSPSSSDGAL